VKSYIVKYKFTNISEGHTFSTFRVKVACFLLLAGYINFGELTPDYITVYSL
jgi:hypothetical protein